MGKLADTSLRLRCVHCQSTETPLWRAGPDGPKTLCNACGVRYKKGKLALYKNKDGKLTAVKSEHALPVHIPPTGKKNSKKASVLPLAAPASPTDIPSKRSVRKVPSEGAIATALAKKPRSRSRRANAGQLPGRYASKTLPDSLTQWRSPSGSPQSSPSSPVESPRSDEARLGLFNSPTSFNMDEPSLYQFTDPEQENMFPDVACLGIECSGDTNNITLLPMPADPSSTEEFSFAFAELGHDASLAIDLPDRVDALRGLVLDRTRRVSRNYDIAVLALSRLCEQRYSTTHSEGNMKVVTVDDCKNFVRAFAHEQSVGLGLNMDDVWDVQHRNNSVPSFSEKTSGLMLSEKTLHSSAAESFRSLMDCSELVGFAEACMVELLAEDVIITLTAQGFPGFEKVDGFRLHGSSLASKPIFVPS